MDERGGLQCVVAPLAPEVAFGQLAQLIIDERQELFYRLSVAAAPLEEQLRHVGL